MEWGDCLLVTLNLNFVFGSFGVFLLVYLENICSIIVIGYSYDYLFEMKKIITENFQIFLLQNKKIVNLINQLFTQCAFVDRKRVPKVNGTFDGYNVLFI